MVIKKIIKRRKYFSVSFNSKNVFENISYVFLHAKSFKLKYLLIYYLKYIFLQCITDKWKEQWVPVDKVLEMKF